MSKSSAEDDFLFAEVNELTEFDQEAFGRISEMVQEMVGLVHEISETPVEALQAISGVVAMVLCTEVETRHGAEHLNDLFYDVIKKSISMADKSGNALWKRNSWN